MNLDLFEISGDSRLGNFFCIICRWNQYFSILNVVFALHLTTELLKLSKLWVWNLFEVLPILMSSKLTAHKNQGIFQNEYEAIRKIKYFFFYRFIFILKYPLIFVSSVYCQSLFPIRTMTDLSSSYAQICIASMCVMIRFQILKQ